MICLMTSSLLPKLYVFYLADLVTAAARNLLIIMSKILSQLSKWFSLDVVYIIVLRRSRQGDLRFL